MYKKILLCLDNSDYANTGIDFGVEIAASTGASLTGCHVYAARLHNSRFRQMEAGLPPQYQKEEELKRQREVHDTLITRGLQIISDSYVTVLQAKAASAAITAEGVSREGKNYVELVKEAAEGGYDLVVLGALGLGKTPTSRIGSVCERVVRRIDTDVLVARDRGLDTTDGRILATVDGSPASFGGLLTALELAEALGREVECVSAFDPDFHYTAFRSIAGMLTEEAGQMFKFKEQEKLHEEIIDQGLAKIYQDHLDTAVALAAERGRRVASRLLSGKPSDEIIKYVRKTNPALLVMGKTGVHAAPGLDIGSNTENCLREAGCNILISSREHLPTSRRARNESSLEWTEEAEAILERIPSFARGVVKNMVENAARKEGAAEVTAELMHKVRSGMDG